MLRYDLIPSVRAHLWSPATVAVISVHAHWCAALIESEPSVRTPRNLRALFETLHDVVVALLLLADLLSLRFLFVEDILEDLRLLLVAATLRLEETSL